eukprot:scaffold1454_cov342-Pavlova_lutheri.AAC.5
MGSGDRLKATVPNLPAISNATSRRRRRAQTRGKARLAMATVRTDASGCPEPEQLISNGEVSHRNARGCGRKGRDVGSEAQHPREDERME